MGGPRPTSACPLRPLYVLTFLLLLPSVRITHQSAHQQEDLSCLNDYMGNVSCEWNCYNQSEKANHQCILTGNITRTSGAESVSCEMMSLSQDPCYRGCHFNFKDKDYMSFHKANLEIKCAGEIVKDSTYQFANHIKLRAPGIPSITQGNLSWSVGADVPRFMNNFVFERQFKREDEPWMPSQVVHGQTGAQRIETLEPLLHLGVRYQARVRVKPHSDYGGTWSDWSPVLTWMSDVGDPPPTPPPQLTGLFLSLSVGLLCGALCLTVVMMVNFCRKGYCCSSFLAKKQYVPDPSQYFQPLHAIHGGDFQKWLSPMFGPEAFAAPQRCDSISPVEVAPVLDTETCQAPDTLLALQGKSSGRAWTGSGQSSCYSNMGYFYSEFQPGHLHIESCPIYFTFPPEADENVPEADTSGTTGTSYERLEQIQQLHFSVGGLVSRQGEPASPDSGFGIEPGELGGINEEEEEEDVVDEEREEEEWKKEKEQQPFTVHFQNIGIPIPIQPILTPFSFLMSPPEFATPIQEWEDTAPAPTYSYTPSPPEGNLPRSASLVIQPCEGGYMTVKEMQNTYSNKSI